MKYWILFGLFLSGIFIPAFNQDTLPDYSVSEVRKKINLNGFVRGGFYSWKDKTDNKPYISSAFSDLGVIIDSDNENFRAFADLRLRYGSEFLKAVTSFDVREAYIKIKSGKWDFSAGQEILKWGRCDFTNPVNRLSPQNLLSRSPDREDMDMANLLAAINYFPSGKVSFEAVILPFYRPSKLIIDPVPLPKNVIINKLDPLLTGKKMMSYGIKADFYLKKTDWSLSWFDGYNPMPGIALMKFTIDMTQTIPVTQTILNVKPYRTRVLGADFETAAGPVGMRGEAAFSKPDRPFRGNEYVPSPELTWVAGVDWSPGIWRITGEYSGKLIPDFIPSDIAPFIGTEPDYSKIAELLAVPGFDLEEYVRSQVAAFNRLYNYQAERYYHSAGLRVDAELAFGKLLPSVFSMYNFVSRDLMLNPEIKLKPYDGLAITVGAEIYTGEKGSLYDLINDFMNSFYISLRADF